jgi:hypothetical protein
MTTPLLEEDDGGVLPTTREEKFLGVPDDYTRPGREKPRRYRNIPEKVDDVRGSRFFSDGTPRFTEQSLTEDIRNLGPEETFRIQRLLVKAGLIGKKTKFRLGLWDDTTVNAYKKAMVFANRYTVDLPEALDMLAQGQAEGAGVDLDGEGDVGGPEELFSGNKTTTQSQVNLTDAQSARGLLRQALRQKLGRAPTKDEMAQFVSSLNSAERANPRSSTTTSTFDEGEQVSSSTSTSGGLDSGAYTDEFTDSKFGQEMGTYQAATTYYDALRDVLRGG